MGYFSENQIELQDKYSDQSYHGFEDQLLWRYEDLKDRYLELFFHNFRPMSLKSCLLHLIVIKLSKCTTAFQFRH